MLDDKNIWKKKFNEDALDDQAWLTPGDHVWDAVSLEIDPPKARKRSLLWLWLLGGMILIMALAYMVISQNKAQGHNVQGMHKVDVNVDLNATTAQLIPEQNTPYASVIDTNNGADNAEVVAYNSDTVDEVNHDTEHLAQEEQNAINQTRVNSALNDSEQNLILQPSTDQSQANRDFVVGKGNAADFNKNVTNNTRLVVSTVADTKGSIETRQQLEALYKIDQIRYTQVAATERKKPVLFIAPTEDINKGAEDRLQQTLRIGSGYETWYFNLNQNYTTALDPADFTHDNGNAYYVNMAFESAVSNKLFVGVASQFTQVRFNSGHNSTVTYDLDQEVNNQNDFELGMASPLGFLSSQLTVERSAQTSQSATDIVVDLNNSHQLQILDAELYVGFILIDKGSLNLSTRLGFGGSYFMGINNVLDAYDVAGDPNFYSVMGNVTSDQTAIKKFVPFVSTGVNLDFAISDITSLGIQFSFSQQLSPIYKEGDFSTIVNRIGTGLRLSHSF